MVCYMQCNRSRLVILSVLNYAFHAHTSRSTTCPATNNPFMNIHQSATLDIVTHRLGSVPGDRGKHNDVIWAGVKNHVAAEHHVVFFSGDVQDYAELMLAHRDNRRYAEWDLESTARLLVRRFPQSHVWVVKASRMELGTFNVFSNFVEWSDSPGSGPKHSHGQRSWRHLQLLLANSVNIMNRRQLIDSSEGCTAAQVNDKSCDGCTTDQSGGCSMCNLDVDISIVGFSKGCVVLNQLVYDLASDQTLSKTGEDKEDEEVWENKLLPRVDSMYWLDGGHNGGSNTWITDRSVLEQLKTLGAHIAVRAHATPYQIKDSLRPWVGREYKGFIAKLQRLDVNVTSKVHFIEDERSIEKHFEILLDF